MKLLWLCNMVPSMIREKLGGANGGGLWVDHVLSDLSVQPDISIHVLCRGLEDASGKVNERVSFEVFRELMPYPYLDELETRFAQVLADYRPDVIHIWGTEFGHTLAMVNACEPSGFLDRAVISIQGLCSKIAEHYADGIPERVCGSSSFRDWIRKDNILQQQEKFVQRGSLECMALKKVRHVIGRTAWDKAAAAQINPEAQYHFCNETLRDVFYQDSWQYTACRKHSVFASSCTYPVKGFHYLLEAFVQVIREYPDATLSVTGGSFLNSNLREWIHRQTYHGYLADLVRKNGLEARIRFLGDLDSEEMKRAFLEANVFVLPSTIENSPNSLGEAMLLGVPAVAARVGGVGDLMADEAEGVIYEPGSIDGLRDGICRIFAMEDAAEAMGAAAGSHARKTHDPETNLRTLLEIYRDIAKG